MNRRIPQKLHFLIDILILVFVLLLALSFFFPSIMVLSKGIEEVPSPITLFEYLNYTSPWLIISFVLSLITIFLCIGLVVLAMLEMFDVISRGKTKEIIGIIICVTAIMAFVCTLVYCMKNTSYSTNTDDVFLKFAPGVSMYVILVCGFLTGLAGIFDSPVFIDNNMIEIKTRQE